MTERISAIRDLAEQLLADGNRLDEGAFNQLFDTALDDGKLSVGARAALFEIVHEHKDRIDSDTTKNRIDAFLAIADPEVRRAAWEHERDDGIIDASEAGQLAELVGDGNVAGRAFSVSAVMVGAHLGEGARPILRTAVERAGPGDVVATLGDVDGEPLLVGGDGRIGLGALPTSTEDELRAIIQLATHTPAEANHPFAGVDDGSVLVRIGAALKQAHSDFSPTGETGGVRLERRQARAGALMLLESAAVRAGEIGDVSLMRRLAGDLIAIASTEPFRKLRDFVFQRYDALALDGLLPANAAATEAVFPSRPQRAAWVADGKIKIRWICDNDGSPVSGAVRYFRSMGFRQIDNGDGSYLMKYAGRGGMPAVEVEIPAPPADDEEPALFDKMDDPTTDIIVYSGHAGYGHRVNHALRDGVDGTGEDKLVILLQCWGEGNVETLEAAFPDAQVLSTTDSTTDGIDHVMFTRLLNGILRDEDWDTIGAGIVSTLEDRLGHISHYDDKDWKRQFFMPNTRAVIGASTDRDRDATMDIEDHIFNVVYPKRPGLAGGYDPLVQDIPHHALDGGALQNAIDAISLVFRYENMLSPEELSRVVWSSDAVQVGGFFVPEAGDLRAFRFVREGDQVRVSLSVRFAHAAEEDLTRMLAVEAGLWWGEQAGLDDVGQAAMSLAMLDRALHQQDSWYWEDGLLDSQALEEMLLFSRYGIGDTSFAALALAPGLDDHGHFEPANFDLVKSFVVDNDLAGMVGRVPTRVGEPLDIPGGVRFREVDLSQEDVDRVVRDLGVDAKVLAYDPDWLSDDEPTNLVVTLRPAAGETQLLSLGLDSLGEVTRAALIPYDTNGIIDSSINQFIHTIAGDQGLEQQLLTTAYERGVEVGGSVADGLAALYESARKQCDPGTYIDEPPREVMRLLAPEERQRAMAVYNRLFSWEAIEAEQQIFDWLAGIEGFDVEAFQPVWVETLIDGGLAAAFLGLFDRLPDHVASGDVSFFRLAGGYRDLSPEEQQRVLAAFQERTGQTNVDVMLGALFSEGVSAEVRETGERAASRAVEQGKPLSDLPLIVFGAIKDEVGLDELPYFWQWDWFVGIGFVTRDQANDIADRMEELYDSP